MAPAASAIEAEGGEAWTITAEEGRARRDPGLDRRRDARAATTRPAIAAALARWKDRGFEPRSFEIGTVFGTGGEVIDTREVRIAIDPVAAGKGAARAAEHAKRFGVRRSGAPGAGAPARRARSSRRAARRRSATRRCCGSRRSRPSETITVADVPTNTGGSQLATGTEDRRYWGAVYVTLDHDGIAARRERGARGQAARRAGAGRDVSRRAARPRSRRRRSPRAPSCSQKIGRRNLTDPFLLCSTQQCQVYAGAGKEDPRTTKAVEKTRGMVLLRDGGGLVDIRYSASCGGHSEDNDAIWGGEPDPSLRGRRDDREGRRCRGSPTRTSTRSSTEDERRVVRPGQAGQGQVPLDRDDHARAS